MACFSDSILSFVVVVVRFHSMAWSCPPSVRPSSSTAGVGCFFVVKEAAQDHACTSSSRRIRCSCTTKSRVEK